MQSIIYPSSRTSECEKEISPDLNNLSDTELHASRSFNTSSGDLKSSNSKVQITEEIGNSEQISQNYLNLPTSVSTMCISRLSPYTEDWQQRKYNQLCETQIKTKIWIGGKWYLCDKAELTKNFATKLGDDQVCSQGNMPQRKNGENGAEMIKSDEKMSQSNGSSCPFDEKNIKTGISRMSTKCIVPHSPPYAYTFVDSYICACHEKPSIYKGTSVFNSITCPLYQKSHSITALRHEKIWFGGKWYFNENHLKQIFHSKISDLQARNKKVTQCQVLDSQKYHTERRKDITIHKSQHPDDLLSTESLLTLEKSSCSSSSSFTWFKEGRKNMSMKKISPIVSLKVHGDICMQSSLIQKHLLDTSQNLTKIWIGGRWYLQDQKGFQEAYPEKTQDGRNKINSNNGRHTPDAQNRTRRIYTSTPFNTSVKSESSCETQCILDFKKLNKIK